ncbi:5-(carboxyamino)imidazole ribonucleotide synthase [Natronospira proteinivora]|uniref:N5-carboxyaminoimidazole ribonucleotide synthase n=1 Tax=Natronospira proteinivora TaxID=1807133 RepID=A0ABT1G8N2_9GAMM|nr:5-(carboxyamino)imidazole ribonucleotide synthase [Natronospira proteinivora]MCP1727679.1 5-(carboxyamino)imidazole ribonucleotide synthase [Natronospira proteinivora]
MSIGIIGAGQLGRMMALAGYPLGLRFTFLDKSKDTPGAQVGDIVLGDFMQAEDIRRLAGEVELLTYDVENVPVQALREAAGDTPVHPAPAILEAAQDRLDEKQAFARHGIETAPYRPVDSKEALETAIEALGMPAVLKRRRLGYDGRGQHFIRAAADIETAWEALKGAPLILEGFVDFDREVSLIGVRNRSGETAFYPLSENSHEDGILRLSVAPAGQPALQSEAETQLKALMEDHGYAGILTVEYFEKDGRLIANEMAPRVHNSGHWTIEGAATSQFENHLRGILDLPLGSTRPRGHAAMINCLGRMPALEPVIRFADTHYHDYGKSPRPRRKLGHITVVRDDRASLDAVITELMPLIKAAEGGE